MTTTDTDKDTPPPPASLDLEASRLKLRQRWELASVLNFLNVFEPLIGKEMKLRMSAEEIEDALINPNASLANLHVALLKGIPPVNKNLSSPGGWVTSLCKKLAEWWPWVAEGKVPLTAEKGEEISKYKELDPTVRLLMLKALCELRTEQDDLISFINDEMKEGKQLSHFRKDKIGEDRTGTSYWYDGDSVIGHRLYREVNKTHFKPKQKGKGCLDSPSTNIEWETLATNLEEFQKVLEGLSSRKDGVEAAVCWTVETEIIPVLEKVEKKKEKALKRQLREQVLMEMRTVGVTRSCRSRKPVCYTFEAYDKAIDDAVKSRKRKDREVQVIDRSDPAQDRSNIASDEDLLKNVHSDEESEKSLEEGMEHDPQEDDGYVDIESSDDDHSEDDSDDDDPDSSENFRSDGKTPVKLRIQKHGGNKTTKSSNDSSGEVRQETRILGAKNYLGQRPTRNSALRSDVVPDSEGSSSDNVSYGDPSEGADSEEEISS